MELLHIALSEPEYQVLISLRSAGKLSVSLMLSWAISSLLTNAEKNAKWDNYHFCSFSAKCTERPSGWELQLRWRGG